ncbi:uncharacterized protein LOC124942711 [Impatiens glandulifera]|uniref:uncharacterized protein LOC124942711 n=1 Tax=Impatiens glandulifera TaxID=253017 RepID=UPI001FB15F92|nr:uncharacterized protein LOC124942711 [Impatiens glandulifera]
MSYCSSSSSFNVALLSVLLLSSEIIGFKHENILSSTAEAEKSVYPEMKTSMMPEIGEIAVKMMSDSRRRRLGNFQVCALCNCCGTGGDSYCLPSPCCYAINCNLPNKPFGFCSFTPKTCNCFGCHL